MICDLELPCFSGPAIRGFIPSQRQLHVGKMGLVLEKNFLNALRPRQNCRYFTDDIFKCIFLNENVCITIKISLKFVPKGPMKGGGGDGMGDSED